MTVPSNPSGIHASMYMIGQCGMLLDESCGVAEKDEPDSGFFFTTLHAFGGAPYSAGSSCVMHSFPIQINDKHCVFFSVSLSNNRLKVFLNKSQVVSANTRLKCLFILQNIVWAHRFVVSRSAVVVVKGTLWSCWPLVSWWSNVFMSRSLICVLSTS